MTHTARCIICNTRATSWTGHVHDGYNIILAGFCREHHQYGNSDKYLPTCALRKAACYGEWKEYYGVLERRR